MNSVKIFLTIFGVCILFHISESLKCRSDDGPTEEEVKKVVRQCMRKVNTNNNSNGQSNGGRNRGGNRESSEENDEDGEDSYESNRHRNNNNNYNGNYPNNYNNNNNQNSRRNRYKRENQNDQQWSDIHSFQDQNQGYNYSGNGNGRQTNDSSDNSCIIQCFFQEMKMTGSNGFPDKHKVLQIMTKDIRDHDLKEFYTDSIDECFHILEMENRRDKCTMSKNLVECLTERAKANCDDFHDETVIF